MEKTNDKSWMVLVAAGLLVLVLFWPKSTGWEISSWLGRFTVRPAPPVVAPVIAPPTTRCLVFSATWCTPCKELKRNINDMQRNGWRVGHLPTDDIEIINVDGRDERIDKYKPRGYPTLVLVDQGGKELSRKSGAISAEALSDWIRSTRK
jgi:thiol-disulfide isomerase/thioredoxin